MLLRDELAASKATESALLERVSALERALRNETNRSRELDEELEDLRERDRTLRATIMTALVTV